MRNYLPQLFSGLRLRLLLLVLLASAPPAALTLYTAWENRQQQKTAWRQDSQKLVQLSTREEDELIGGTRQLLRAITESAQVRDRDWRSTRNFLAKLLVDDARYLNLGVINTNGDVLVSALPLPGAVNLADRSYFQRAVATRSLSIGDYQVGRISGKPSVNFGYPVQNYNGEVAAVVYAALDLDWFNRSQFALQSQLPPGATWTKIDLNGTILVRQPAPEQWIGRAWPEKSLLKTVLSRTNGHRDAVNAQGIPTSYMFVSTRSALVAGDVITILSIPKSVLYAEANQTAVRSLALLALAAGLVFVLGGFGSSLLILRPVRALVNASARLAAGDLSTRTGLPYHGAELGPLARTFDQMAEALERRDLDHRKAEEELRKSEERFRALVQNSTDVIGIADENGIILYRSPSLQSSLGYEVSEVVGKSIARYIWPEDLVRAQAQMAELIKVPGTTLTDEYRLLHRDGSCRHIECTTSNYLHEPAIHGVVFNYRDITARKRAEEKLKDYSRKLKELSRRLVEAQETERRHLARELHDEIGQTLTVAQLDLQALLQSPGSEAQTPRLRESLEAIERVLEQVHDISLNLRPSMLDDLGLEPALRWYLERQAVLVGLQAEFHSEPLAQRLDPAIETECFRVAQGALTNVVRHAQARIVTVDLRVADGQLHLRVRDDGSGFDVAVVREKAVRGASLGLLSMEERTTLAGGGLEFTSAPGQGTEVHAWFPLKWQLPTV
jgi:PAS domain S-box-containing protein